MSKIVRIGGINIPADKHVVISLSTAIFGIGLSTSQKICEKLKIEPSTKVKDLSTEVIDKIRHEIGEYLTEGELRREIAGHVRRLEIIKSYRGLRRLKKLPVRGQRTRTNARTTKGPRKAIRKN